MNIEEDGTSMPFLVLENVVLLLRSTSNRGDNLASLVDAIATVMMLVHALCLISAQSSSDIINSVQMDLVSFVIRSSSIVPSMPSKLLHVKLCQ